MHNTEHKFSINQVVKFNPNYDQTKDNSLALGEIAVIQGIIITPRGVRYQYNDRDSRYNFAEAAVMSVIQEITPSEMKS